MFTGIVEEVGRVAEVARTGATAVLQVSCREVVDGAAPGDSVSVNGCCVTVTRLTGDGFAADLMGETLARTALGDLAVGQAVNLERALAAGGRFGGHLVQGHIDAVGEVTAVERRPGETALTVALPPALAAYVVEKGSIAVDGVSLTVAAVDDGAFSVALVPHTLAATTLGGLRPGDRVNLEVDVVAKYVERMLRAAVAGGEVPSAAGEAGG